MKAAGILFLTPDKQGLFLKRSEASSMPLTWCIPGGTTEGDETAEQTAIRETIEEIGFMPSYLPKGAMTKHCVTTMPIASSPGVPLQPDAAPPEIVEFTTFVQQVEATFEPRLNPEHVGYSWAPIDDPPQPIHPGCDVALKKFNWNELDIARAIRDGTLASPQQYENMWLFAMRITGTGFAYRKKLGEFVHRDPEKYLNEEFLARCNGLPVIVNHPKTDVLDSREFAERVVGGVMLPYIKGDEVWAVCRVYDALTAEGLINKQLSTSPAVRLRAGKSTRIDLNGETILFEGDIKLLDHLAICLVGVWDKGKDPSGVAVDEAAIGDSQMADGDKTEVRKDPVKGDQHIEPAKESGGGGTGPEQLDKMLTGLHAKLDSAMTKMDDCVKRMDSVGTRMDAMEEEVKKDRTKKDAMDDKKDAKADADKEDKKEEKADTKKDASETGKEAKEVIADKKKADADEKEDKKGDAVADSNDDVQKRLDALSQEFKSLGAKIPAALTDSDRNLLSEAQWRADSVFVQFGERAPHPTPGETPIAYRRRIAMKLKQHSPDWKGIDLGVIADDNAFAVAENRIYTDSAAAAMRPDGVPDGVLRAVERQMPSGHKEITFRGHPSAWMNTFAGQRQAVKRINPKPDMEI